MTAKQVDGALDELGRRAAGGDDRAFTELVGVLVPGWYRLAQHMLGDRAGAEAAVHEMAVKLYLALPKWRGNSTLGTWAHRIAVNVCHDLRRTARRSQRLVPLETLVNSAPEGEDGWVSGDPVARDVLHRAVANLPPEQAMIVALRYGAGLRFADIADVLDIPQGTVSTRLRRALASLAQTLAPFFDREQT